MEKLLANIIKETNIEHTVSEIDKDKYSRDWSLFRIVPSAIVYPKNAQEIGEIVRVVSRARREDPSNMRLSVTPRAAGSDMTGGPLNHGIIMDVTKYMNTVRSVVAGDFGSQASFFGHRYPIRGQAVVEPGCFYRDFEPKTHSEGLEMACYPASRQLAAVGGMVANNGAGEKSLKYGQNKDFVAALRVVLHDGNEYEIKPLTWQEFSQLCHSREDSCHSPEGLCHSCEDLNHSREDSYRSAEDLCHSREGGNPVQNTLDPGSQPHASALSGMTLLADLYLKLYTEIKDNWDLIQSKKPTTSKNSAGYLLWDVISTDPSRFEAGDGVFDPTKLFVGAQGTTGIISEITYKLVPVESESKLLVVYIDDLAQVPEVVHRLMKYDVEMLEMYDDNTFKIGVQFFRDFLKNKGFFGAIRYSLRFIPELLMALRGGIPKLIVLAEFYSNSESEITTEVHDAHVSLSDLGLRMRIVTKKRDEEKFWDFRHDSFKILTEHSKKSRVDGEGTRTAPFIDDIAVNPDQLPEYLPKLIQILEREKFVYTIAGHLGNGNFHIIPLMDMHDPINREKIVRVSREVYELALAYGATITAEHNDGIIRTPFLSMQFGEDMVALFSRIKSIMDPLGIFNPLKKVGATMQDIERYLE
jgi:FAD/FMN-containing dehydrogenase